jgi:hypothetical protein
MKRVEVTEGLRNLSTSQGEGEFVKGARANLPPGRAGCDGNRLRLGVAAISDSRRLRNHSEKTAVSPADMGTL